MLEEKSISITPKKKIEHKPQEKRASAIKQGSARRGETVLPLRGIRKIIATRMVQSVQTAAQAMHQINVDMTEAVNLREAYKKEGNKISYNDIISYAVCRALKDYPIMNSELTDGGIVIKEYVNLGIAVALDNGLIVPVIYDADLKSIEELSLATKDLADRAKSGKLTPDEYNSGTFTISNLGMYGLDSFTAIVNPPESGILAIGNIVKTPMIEDNDEIVVRPVMVLTLTYDHRVVDGAPAAQFIARAKYYIEHIHVINDRQS